MLRDHIIVTVLYNYIQIRCLMHRVFLSILKYGVVVTFHDPFTLGVAGAVSAAPFVGHR